MNPSGHLRVMKRCHKKFKIGLACCIGVRIMRRSFGGEVVVKAADLAGESQGVGGSRKVGIST